MASYSNLTSLAGLQVGDVVTYSATDAIAIDFKKYKVHIKLEGIGWRTGTRGGLTEFDIDTNLIPSQTLTFSAQGGTSLCYGSSYDAYYRIAVAGNTGYPSSGGKGGGTTGGSGSSASNSGVTVYGGGGGTQTAGGSRGTYSGSGSGILNTYGTAGSFERFSSYAYYKYWGAGWYSGGTGASTEDTYGHTSATAGMGGGSGFIIGKTTTTYPSGYFGDSTLRSTISNAITNNSVAINSSTLPAQNPIATGGEMTITIVSLPPSSFPQYYSNAWHDTEWKYYSNGWHDVEVKRYNGSSWQ